MFISVCVYIVLECLEPNQPVNGHNLLCVLVKVQCKKLVKPHKSDLSCTNTSRYCVSHLGVAGKILT